MSYATGRLLRTIAAFLDIAALAVIAAGLIYTADVVFSDRDARQQLRSAQVNLYMTSDRRAPNRPLRVPRGEPMPGNAADDYDALCPEVSHRNGFRLPRTAAELAGLTDEQRAALESPRQLAAIDRFVRAPRREDVRFGTSRIHCRMELILRPSAVYAAAMVAAARGDLDLAFQRAAAIVDYATDTLGRSDFLRMVSGSGAAARATELMLELAGRLDRHQADRWAREVERLRGNLLAPRDIPIAVVASGGYDLEPLSELPPELLEASARWVSSLDALVETEEPLAACPEQSDPSPCKMVDEIVADHAVVAERLELLASVLAIRHSEDSSSRL